MRKIIKQYIYYGSWRKTYVIYFDHQSSSMSVSRRGAAFDVRNYSYIVLRKKRMWYWCLCYFSRSSSIYRCSFVISRTMTFWDSINTKIQRNYQRSTTQLSHSVLRLYNTYRICSFCCYVMSRCSSLGINSRKWNNNCTHK